MLRCHLDGLRAGTGGRGLPRRAAQRLDEHLPTFLAEWGDNAATARRRPDGDGDAGGPRDHGRHGAAPGLAAHAQPGSVGGAINWPIEWGGREATVTAERHLLEEMARARPPGIYNANGLWQIGPMIIQWGTDEQKERWIPNILDAVDHWCQGFSEPEAGLRPRQPADARRAGQATTTS